ncbi:hypothetical protein [Glutamicibacter sp. NPDC087344]|uniref:hypothetical protein n=1 Tax=Glutamicibacter sp. NPDC087344 TaxID=3363994 RepID=UPI0038074D07
MADLPYKASEVSGYVTKQTVVNLQRWLKKVGYYAQGRSVDGSWGYWTTLGVQQYLRTKYLPGYPKTRCYAGALDGDFGTMTKSAMGDAVWYVIGARPGSTMGGYCAGGSCTISWPHVEVVKCWQYFLNNNAK